MRNGDLDERETRILKHEIHGAQVGGWDVFGRKKKEKDTIGVSCPYCEFNNPLGSETCAQCYYDLNRSARDQPMAEPRTTGDEIMSLLLGENEGPEETPEVVQAVLSMDDVTVDVDQYTVADPLESGDEDAPPESFDFIKGEGPTLSQTITAQEDDEPVELTAADAPKEYIAFELGDVDPLAEVAEPVHTGKGGLYSPTVATPNDDDLLGEVGPATNGATPDLPDLPEDDEVPSASNLAQATVTEPTAQTPDLPDDVPVQTNASQPAPFSSPDVPDLPDLPEDDEPAVAEPTPSAEPAIPEQVEGAGAEAASTTQTVPESAPAVEPTHDENRIWPWPKGEPWTPTQVYQEVVVAMEHIKHGRMEKAAHTLDALGPHLDVNLDMLLHISVLMQHLGRHDHVKWTLDMAAYVYPSDAHVQQARGQLLA
jgi:hypothetical protein